MYLYLILVEILIQKVVKVIRCKKPGGYNQNFASKFDIECEGLETLKECQWELVELIFGSKSMFLLFQYIHFSSSY